MVKQLTKLSQEQREIISLISDGRTLREVAKEIGCHHETIRYRLKELESIGSRTVVDHLRSKYDWDLVRKIVKLFNISYLEIADSTGYGYTTVKNILRGKENYTNPHTYLNIKREGAVFHVYAYVIKRYSEMLKESEQTFDSILELIRD